jgi:ATP-dependent Clp protease adapter protein ClpS
MPAPTTTPKEETHVDQQTEHEPLYDVIVIDNPVNTYEEVMRVVQEAISCTVEQAYQIAWEIDHTGAACVATVEHIEAQRIAGVIRRIGIEVRVEKAA